MDKTEMIAAWGSMKTEALALVPIATGLHSTILTLQSGIAQLEDQIAAQPAGAYDQDFTNAFQAFQQAFLRLSGAIRQQPATPTAPVVPPTVLPVLTQTVVP
jgi:hypothetical protein